MYLRRIRLKHPIFHLLSNSAFKFIMDNGFLFKLKETQTVYKESQPARANIYFVLYGQYEFSCSVIKKTERTPNAPKFGEIMGIGWTIGEEILYGPIDLPTEVPSPKTSNDQIRRHETCHSINESCLLQLSVEDLVTMSSQKAAVGGGGMLVKDYEVLLSFLEKNFDVKNAWRKEQGLVPDDD